ncbi:S-adenosyl-L-methionine-dependent methyltransferase [Mucidula mucida]|nr:S-adenosyl-L-methionine-dependent methyltransferase [Mucidula mucida]
MSTTRPDNDDDVSYVGDDDSAFFRQVHGRQLNTLNPTYMLPADEDEVKRMELYHRMLKFVLDGRNYVGPVKEALQFGQQRRILDLGTGGGLWAIEMADEFPRAEVIGIDLAPIQPRDVPPNCTFELYNLEEGRVNIPYSDGYFDLVHARCMFTGIRDYPQLIREISRVLRPGGLVILIESELTPLYTPAEGVAPHLNVSTWYALWQVYMTCLQRHGVDPTVPTRIDDIVVSTGRFENVVKRNGNIPVGFWPEDPVSLTVGQLQWMDYELLLPALRPLFLTCELPDRVDKLITEAQQVLYNPEARLMTRINIVHASKSFQT